MNSIAADGKKDSKADDVSNQSSRDIIHQVDGKSSDDAATTADDDQSSSPIPYRIEYTDQVIQSVIPTIIIHYDVPKKM